MYPYKEIPDPYAIVKFYDVWFLQKYIRHTLISAKSIGAEKLMWIKKSHEKANIFTCDELNILLMPHRGMPDSEDEDVNKAIILTEVDSTKQQL